MSQLIIATFDSLETACLWGACLGAAGGILLVLLRLAIWGADLSASAATILGLLYGIAPGIAFLYFSIFVVGQFEVKTLTALVMSCSMAGLLVGGFLDRVTDAIITHVTWLQT